VSQIDAKQRYWRANLRLVAACMVVWFVVSFGFGILLSGPLDQVALFGVNLGFWFAQQGSIFTFICVIFFYAWRMNRLDREHDVDEE
jgi:putative solute:sodium symporter small subunit